MLVMLLCSITDWIILYGWVTLHAGNVTMFNNRLDYLVRVGYTWNSSELLISQRLLCQLPSKVLLQWQSC